jgi:hypothetical protein
MLVGRVCGSHAAGNMLPVAVSARFHALTGLLATCFCYAQGSRCCCAMQCVGPDVMVVDFGLRWLIRLVLHDRAVEC